MNKNKIIGANTERNLVKNYSIFNNSLDNKNNNKSKNYLFQGYNNNDHPYNKILNKNLISSSDFSLINHSKKKSSYNKELKKKN